MLNSEITKTFNERRAGFTPYGLTCERWTPALMKKPDRHNEIEINFCSEGSLTYLLRDSKIIIPAERLTVFWGLVPHQIIHYESSAPYFVCTIPFSHFLDWKLSSSFVSRILKGEVLFEMSKEASSYDSFLLKNWFKDINSNNSIGVTLLEIQARLARMATHIPPENGIDISVNLSDVSQVERIAIYIAQNYSRNIKASDIGQAVGLHPDYANTIFKRMFGSTLSEHILEERVSHAQRRLITTDLGISEIGYECGFNSISRFNAAFMKKNRCTPREFRKNYQ